MWTGAKPSIPNVSPLDRPAFRHVTKSGLGPHVVGQRVVVRRILRGETGPSGGPAMTDLLGVCEDWTATTASIRAEDGALVQIAVADIVSGKPVPPRPSIRHRVAVRDAESHAAAFWPGVLREPYGDWELRTEPAPEGRLRKRANSCLAVGDPGTDTGTAAAAIEQFYAAVDRPALVQVEAESDLEQEFVALGWTPVPGDALYLLGGLSRARPSLGVPTSTSTLTVDGPRLTATAPGGTGRAAVDGDWLGLYDLAVDAERRRQGLGSDLVRTLLDAGAERGATNLWLHVEVDNVAALFFYERLGLVEHHGCRYLAAPA